MESNSLALVVSGESEVKHNDLTILKQQQARIIRIVRPETYANHINFQDWGDPRDQEKETLSESCTPNPPRNSGKQTTNLVFFFNRTRAELSLATGTALKIDW